MVHASRPHASRRSAGMSKAVAGLERSRRAIVEHLERTSHRHARGGRDGWFARLWDAAGTWWRDHPAHLALDLARPLLSKYAARYPWSLLALGAASGVLVQRFRPWRLLSLSALLTVAKSSQLSRLVLPALAALRRPRR